MKQIATRILSMGFLLVLMASLFSSCGPESEAKNHRDKGSFAIVISEDATLRIDPYIFSSRISLLTRGTSVEILDKSQEKTWIGNSSDYWYKVRLDNGMTGWLYAKNLKILKTTSREDVESLVARYWEDEASVIRQGIAGRWWSVDRTGAFTSHGLDMTAEGKFRLYGRGGESTAPEGEYTINVHKHEIVFLGPTSFDGTLTYIKRGKMFKITGDKGLIFKKISDHVSISGETPPRKQPDRIHG
jgi:hypothetical protein